MNEILASVVPLILLLAASAFFSGSEAACSSLTKLQLRRLRKQKDPASKSLSALMSDVQRLLTAILIGNNLVNNWAASLATAFAISLLGESGIGAATALMTVLIIIFGEISPKTVASKHPLKIASAIAPALLVLEKILFPFIFFFTKINGLFLAAISFFFPQNAHRITEDELKTVMDLGRRDGVLEEKEHKLLHKAWEFTDLRIREILIPRTSIAAVNENCTVSEARTAFRAQSFSRMPVYSGSLDNVVGLLHYRDILIPGQDDSKKSIESLIKPIHFVSEMQTASKLLEEFRAHGQHLAVVLDEHGATAGLVTRRDAISAVFGGIHDEYDLSNAQSKKEIQIVDSRYVRAPGEARLEEINTVLGVEWDSEFYETVGGFVLELAGRLPSIGERFQHENAWFIVEDKIGRKISRIGILLDSKE